MVEQDRAEIGRRVEQLRRRAGLSREKLAGLADISPTLIKFIETGRRALTLRAAQRLAPLLGVRDLSELFGPAVQYALDPAVTHKDVPAVRQALMSWSLTTPSGEPATPEYLRGAVDAAWRTWHTSRQQRSEAGAVLPGLLADAQRSVRLLDGDERRRASAMLAQVYHLAQAYLAWHGDRELCWMTADRGMAAALDADDPLAIASGTWYTAHLLRAVGHSEDALERLREARALVEPYLESGPEYAAMVADIDLNAALTKARAGDQGGWADWESAVTVVRGLPDGYVHPWTRVGPVLVDVYGVMVAVDLGDPDEARRRAQNLDPATIPSTERRARHLVELARGTDLDGSPEATLHLLQRAAAVSPETVRFSPQARDMLLRLAMGGPASIRPDAETLALAAGAMA
jgi:transcriptional regulator with XRE-family HTH domain